MLSVFSGPIHAGILYIDPVTVLAFCCMSGLR